MRSIPPTAERPGAAEESAARGHAAAAGQLAEAPSADHEVLRLEGLDVTFATAAGEIAAVRELSLTIRRGECVGVVGESGAGKSQAFLAAVGLLASNGRAAGAARFGSLDLLRLGRAELDRVRGARIGMVFQDPMTSLTPHIPVGEQIAEPIVCHLGVSWREARLRALALLRRVHVTDVERRAKQYPHELSGGLRQRVMIAIALACDPDLLIADEPTTALDVTIQAQILALLAELKRERGMAMVLITHDLGAVAGVADRVAVMQDGRIVELDTVNAVLKQPRHPCTRSLLRAMPTTEEVSAAARAQEDAGISAAVARELGPGDPGRSTAGLDVVGEPGAREVRLQLSRLTVRYDVRKGFLRTPDHLRAIDGVSLELRSGEALGVVGESGCGKSTLARATLQLIRPTSGCVVWMGQALETLSARELKPLRRDLQIVFQDPLASLDPLLTVGEIVAEPLRVHRPELDARGRAHAVEQMLRRVGLTPDMVNRYPHEFSGGQCQRIGIARAMILEPRLLVCDEPVSALDVSIQAQIVSLLADLKREQGMSILFVSHNLAVVRQMCERVLVLYLGRMMELAPSDALYTQPLHPYTRELLAAVPVPDPDIQPARLSLARLGEPPSPLTPPSGCVYRTRCPHATDVCRESVPDWTEARGAGRVACHHWRELSPFATNSKGS